MPPSFRNATETAKVAQGAVQAAPTVAAALAPPPLPAPATAPAPTVPAPRREAAPRDQQRRRAPPPPPAPKAQELPPSAPPATLPPVTSTPIGVGPLREGAYINPEETFRRVDEMRMQRLQRAGQAARQARGDLPPGVEAFTPSVAAPESALRSVDAYRTELDKRGEQYQRLSGSLTSLAEKRRELEQIRAKEGTAPTMTTVKRELSPTERNLEAVGKLTQDVQRQLAQARAGLQEMGLTEEQIKLYD